MNALIQTIVPKLDPLLPVDAVQWELKVSEMPTTSLDKLLKVAPVLESTIKMAKEEMKERLKKGEESSVYELTLRKGKDTVTDLGKAQEALAPLGLDGEAFEGALTLSVSELQATASKRAPRGQKDAAAARVMSALAQAGVLKLGEETETLTRKK